MKLNKKHVEDLTLMRYSWRFLIAYVKKYGPNWGGDIEHFEDVKNHCLCRNYLRVNDSSVVGVINREEAKLKCQSCGKPVDGAFHLCPYDEDVGNCKNACNCCESCRANCTNDI